MELNSFIYEMSDMLQSDDKTPVLDWVTFAYELAEGSETSLAAELDDVYHAMCYVRNNFSYEVLEQSMRTTMLANEIIYGAMFFQQGADAGTVRGLAENGTLECGYIPSGADEVGTLSLVRIGGNDGRLLEVYHEQPELITRTIRRMAEQAASRDVSLFELLADREATSLRMYKLQPDSLKQAFLHAYDTTSAVGRLFTYFPKLDLLTEEVCPVLEERQARMEKDMEPNRDNTLRMQ